MNTAQKIWGKTQGYKTKTGAVLLAIYSLLHTIAPELMTGKTEAITRNLIDVLIITGGADWVYRNRHNIVKKISNLFTKNKKNGT